MGGMHSSRQQGVERVAAAKEGKRNRFKRIRFLPKSMVAAQYSPLGKVCHALGKV